MNFEIPESVRELRDGVEDFMRNRVIASESAHFKQLQEPEHRWTWTPVLKELRYEARSRGLWNFPLGAHLQGRDLMLSEYAPIAEIISQPLTSANS